jgi:hypothetical protein
MMVPCWGGNVAGLHMCILWRTLTLSESINKEGCSTTRDIQMIGAANFEKKFEFVSI